MQDQERVEERQNVETNLIDAAIAEVMKTATATGELLGSTLHQFVEQSTETVGRLVTPIAENQFVQYATKVPGLNWLMAAIGQVNVEKVQQEMAALRQQYPLETPEQLANRVINDVAVKAAGVGLVTNFVPPLALSLFAVDLTAIAALQAEMIYRIAAVYGFSLTEPSRRGEVVAIWGLSTGGAGVLKTGLSFVEILPVVGTIVGPGSNAALLYSLGHLARYFYDEKKKSSPSSDSAGA
jgi:uncharacterized protein (DUF697 family)